jgi:hypothetical protein
MAIRVTVLVPATPVTGALMGESRSPSSILLL